MPGKVFVDSNIFIYAKIKAQDLDKHLRAQDLQRSLDGEVVISVQVLNEFYNTLIKCGVSDNSIQQSLKNIIQDTQVLSITPATVAVCWEVRSKYKYSYYDSLILSSALESGCTALYTEDMQHGQLIGKKMKIVNPFTADKH